jgi:hypothetical protein
MTAAFCLGLMMVGKQVRRIWAARSIDHPTDPVSLYRFVVLLVGGAVASRGFAEALSLWSWSSGDARTIEHVAEFQLRKAPLPVDMWSRWPQLRRPVLILLVSLLMAAAAVGLR